MHDSMTLKRSAPTFPDLCKSTLAVDSSRWPKPRKRSRFVESGDASSGLSWDDWLEIESILEEEEAEALSPPLKTLEKKECVPGKVTKSLSDALYDMIWASYDAEEPSPSSPPSSDDLSLVSAEGDASPSGASPKKISSSTTTDLEPEAGKLPEAELLTLTSFPFRVYSADENFFQSTGLTPSRVIGQPLLSLFSSNKAELNPHITDTPMDVFDKDGTLVTISKSADGPSTRMMKIEPVWAQSEDEFNSSSQVTHYKVTLQ